MSAEPRDLPLSAEERLRNFADAPLNDRLNMVGYEGDEIANDIHTLLKAAARSRYPLLRSDGPEPDRADPDLRLRKAYYQGWNDRAALATPDRLRSDGPEPDRADPERRASVPPGDALTDAEVQVVYTAFETVNTWEAKTPVGRREIVEPLYEAFIAVRNARILGLLATPDRADPAIGSASAEPEPERRAEGLTDEDIARLFHETYERLAPSFGYETRLNSAVGWEYVPEPNKSLMVAVAHEVRAALSSKDEPLDVERALIAAQGDEDGFLLEVAYWPEFPDRPWHLRYVVEDSDFTAEAEGTTLVTALGYLALALGERAALSRETPA